MAWTTAFGAPAGLRSGSLELSTDGTTAAKAGLYNHSMLGTPLSQVTALSYATYQQAASFAGADASYQLQIDVDGTLGARRPAVWLQRAGPGGDSSGV